MNQENSYVGITTKIRFRRNPRSLRLPLWVLSHIKKYQYDDSFPLDAIKYPGLFSDLKTLDLLFRDFHATDFWKVFQQIKKINNPLFNARAAVSPNLFEIYSLIEL